MPIKILLMCISFSIMTGATFNLAKFSVDYFSAASAAAWRFSLAALAMLILFLWKENLRQAGFKHNALGYLVLGIVGIFGSNALFFLGLSHTSAINGSLIMGTNPIVTTILSFFLLKMPVTKRQWLGIVFSFIGVVLVLTQGSLEVIRTLSFSIGDIYCLFGNICWALYTVLGKRLIKNSSSLSTTTYTMVVGAFFLILVAHFNPSPVPLPQIPLSAWGAICFMAFFTSVLGYLIWNVAISVVGTNKTAIFFNLVPVVTMLISLVTGTKATLPQLCGAVLVILGVLTATGLLRLRSKKNPVFLNGKNSPT